MSAAQSLAAALRQVAAVLLLGVLPAMLALFMIVSTIHGPSFLYDFHGDLYNAGVAILHGRDPYQPAFLARLAALAEAGARPPAQLATPVYPAPDLLVSVPLALLPYKAAALAFAAIGIAALLAGLRLLGVRDPRCYGATLLSWPALHSIRLGQVNGLLVLGLAIVWRYRDRVIPPAAAVAATIVAKVFLWPVALFLLARRRYSSAGLAVAIGVGAVLVAWTVIGFDGFTAYPRLLSELSRIEGGSGVSLVSLVQALGGSRALGEVAGLAAGAVLIGLALSFARRPDGAARSFALLVIASLVASPLVWPHYLTLLFVAVALLAPTFGPLWLVPVLAWLAPVEQTHGRVPEIALYLALDLIVATVAAEPLLRRLIRAQIVRPPEVAAEAAGVVRLRHGLKSTSSRSYIASQRPNKGPEDPDYTQVEGLKPRTANRPT